MNTNINKQSGYTLVEMLVVIAIMMMLIAMAIPFDLSYRKKMELKNSTKQLRALFWEAQDRALAPSNKYATSYKISLTKGSAGGITVGLLECLTIPSAITESCTAIGSKSQVILGTNITVSDIKLGTTLLDLLSNSNQITTSFFVGNGRTAGQISFWQGGTLLGGTDGTLLATKTRMDVILGTKLDSTLSYDIIVDGATNSITYK